MSTVAPAVAPATEASVTVVPAPVSPALRLRPALVNGSPIHIQCESWCSEDHVAANERHLADVAHTSATADLMAPRADGPPKLLACARLVADAFGDEEARTPLVTVDIEDIHGMYLRARSTEEFADSVIAFGLELHRLARMARGA